MRKEPAPTIEPESETVEYKESFQEDCLKDLSAFANTRGGTLRVGVRDDGTVVGWSGGSREEESIASRISDTLGVHPRRLGIDPFIGVGGVLSITMSEAAFPVAVRGRYYRRVGNSTREVTDAERVRFLLERTGQSWDGLPCDALMSELSSGTLTHFRSLARERLPELSSSDSDEAVLDKLKLLSPDGSVKRGAFLLFGTNPNSLFRSAEIQIGRFADAVTILDDQLVRGNLFDQLDRAIQAVRKHLLVRYEIPNFPTGGPILEDLQRKEIWEIPLPAIREAILNALIHRDYTVNGSIMIRIYDDRMTIDNPGGLLEGMTVGDLLKQSHKSLRRNPFIAETIYYTKYIERWGTGTTRMRDACRADGVPEPEFAATAHDFTITFRRGGRPQSLRSAPTLSENEAIILEMAKREGRVTAGMCIEQLRVSRWQAFRLLNRLVDHGLLAPHGEGRWRYYAPT